MSVRSYTSGPDRTAAHAAVIRAPTQAEYIAAVIREEAIARRTTRPPVSLGGPSWSKPA